MNLTNAMRPIFWKRFNLFNAIRRNIRENIYGKYIENILDLNNYSIRCEFSNIRKRSSKTNNDSVQYL
jgi:hypothetical protein